MICFLAAPCLDLFAFTSEDFKVGWGPGWTDPYRFDVSYTNGNGIGYRGSYTTLQVFESPKWLTSSTVSPFVDVRLHLFNGGKKAGNGGLGTRYSLPHLPAVMGYYVFYDFLLEKHKYLQQLGGGYELFTPYVDFRMNANFPIGPKYQIANEKIYNHYKGGYVFKAGKMLTPFAEIDAELGSWISSQSLCPNAGLYLAGGPYYYFSKTKGDPCEKRGNVIGGRLRCDICFNDYLSLKLCGTYDSFWHTRLQAKLTVNIPFGLNQPCEPSTSLKQQDFLSRIAKQPVYRQEIIPLTKQTVFKWNWAASPLSSCL